ncbi:hypothetical protein BCR39DRAFT_262771 [Naematelia encephala]|uniref:Protein kinase domain-containing protein n=1 Tax=Naematelia encephala TaxID=71784 RepID=A0A1Y2AUW7_9TREE|nr:hypothetical protein BCR39DRAFT_262771 [Naematelia encephala]
MIYGNPPFASIPGGPLPRMNVIADPAHEIQYPDQALPRASVGADGQAIDVSAMAVPVPLTAIDTMRRCLAYRKEHRLTIPELLRHPFLRPEHRDLPAIPPDATTITKSQMALLVNFVLRSNRLPVMSEQDRTAEDLFAQLVDQNSD